MSLHHLDEDTRTWHDLVMSSEPDFLREAADLAETFGRDLLAAALRESADECEEMQSPDSESSAP